VKEFELGVKYQKVSSKMILLKTDEKSGSTALLRRHGPGVGRVQRPFIEVRFAQRTEEAFWPIANRFAGTMSGETRITSCWSASYI
jgi:hypothetical protein